MNYYNYFTEIEEHFVRRRGKHLLISPMDWSLISTWRESGVPLHVALRGIDISVDNWHSRPRRGSDRLSSLFYCHDAVMAEYARHLETHLGESQAEGSAAPSGSVQDADRDTDGSPDKISVLEFLKTRLCEIKALRAKHFQGENAEGIERILSRMDGIIQAVEVEGQPDFEAMERDLGMLDELLIGELRCRLSREKQDEWEVEARKELKVYKKRLPKETYVKIVDNYIRGRIHRLFNVGELSLFNL